jgi:homoserine O-acetyltransferase
LRVHYRTLGTPRRDGSGSIRNAVLIVHGTTGAGTQFLSPRFADELYRAGQPLDTAKYYVILPDGIGHGNSSKPSDGLRAKFPRYGYGDMVEAERRLLAEHLGVTHLRLVMGTSMGGMHSWVWVTTHPAWMDAAVPLASVPTEIAGRNRMVRRMMIDDITGDPGYNGGDYTTQPRGLDGAMQVLYLMGSAPVLQHAQAPTRAKADTVFETWMRQRRPSYDANDVLYAIDASWDYDPSPLLERVTVPVLAINSADDFVNPPELGLMEQLMPRVRQGRYVLIPTSDKTRGHGTHTEAVLWKDELGRFLASVPEKR